MVGQNPFRDVTIFVALYLVLSLPPFLYLNQDLSSSVVNLALAAVAGTTGLVIVASLFLINEGVGRYTAFLLTANDALSIVVDLSFLLAAVSWWLVPELAVRYSLGAELRFVLAAIIICQLPMVVFLSLLTIIGRTRESS